MGKSRDYRGPRRRAFDDDVFPMADMPSMRPAYPSAGGFNRDLGADSGPVVDATVKWFNPEKGFGFAELADGSGDVFLHIGVLQQAGASGGLFEVVGQYTTGESYGALYPKGSANEAALNKAIEAMTADGTIKALSIKYLGSDPTSIPKFKP